MFCQNCGASNNEGAKFCASCGKPMAPIKNEPIATGFVAPTVQPVVNYAASVGQATPFQVEPAVAQTSQPQPPKKKKTGLLVGIIVGALVIIGAIIAVLFATGTFDKDTKKEEKTEQTENKKKEETSEEEKEENKEETNKNVAQGYGSYVAELDVWEEVTLIEEDRKVTFQVPTFEIIDDIQDTLNIDLNSFILASESRYQKEDGIYYLGLGLVNEEGQEIYIGLSYSSEELTIENLNAGVIEYEGYDKNGKENTVLAEFDANEMVFFVYAIEDVVVQSVTNTGYKAADGVFYDAQGNEIDNETYGEEVYRVVSEMEKYLLW